MAQYDSPGKQSNVIMRMYHEDAAMVFAMHLGVDDIPVALPGDPQPKPFGLWQRPPDRSRSKWMWYFVEMIGGKFTCKSTGCEAKDLAGAQAWVLTLWARRSQNAMARLAPEAVPFCDLASEAVDIFRDLLARGQIKPVSLASYEKQVERLARCFKTATLADIMAGGRDAYFAWAKKRKYAPNTMLDDARMLMRVCNEALKARGSGLRVHEKLGCSVPRDKWPFEPDELDRIMVVLDDYVVYGPDLKPLMTVDPETGIEMPVRRSLSTRRSRYPFKRAVPLGTDTGTRNRASCEVTWTDTTGPHVDLDDGVLHRRGLMKVDSKTKKRGSCVLSPEFLALARKWADEDLPKGIVHLIHDWRGNPLKSLSSDVWKGILEDARVPYRVLHCLKDTAIQIARREGVSIYDAAERFATTVKTLENHYGADWDMAIQIDSAKAQGAQKRWRAAFEAMQARRAIAETGRRKRDAAAKPLKAKRRKVNGRTPLTADVQTTPAPTKATPDANPKRGRPSGGTWDYNRK